MIRNETTIKAIYTYVLKHNAQVEIEKIQDNMYRVFVSKEIIRYNIINLKATPIVSDMMTADGLTTSVGYKNYSLIMKLIENGDAKIVDKYIKRYAVGTLCI